MNRSTRIFLILLRLAIGWHFLFEGIEKIESVSRGTTDSGRPFSSEAYLREANGPLGGLLRAQIGDPDAKALEFLTLQTAGDNQDPARTPAHTRISPALEAEWNAYFERFVHHYEISPEKDKVQYEHAKVALEQAKEQAGQWLLKGTKEVERSFPTTSVRLTLTNQQRIDEYRKKLQEIAKMVNQELPVFDKDVAKQRLKSAKAEAAGMRAELLADLSRNLQDALQNVLTDDQKKQKPLGEREPASYREWDRLEWIDAITRWGLVVVGIGLLIGLFTRTCCWAGALFLLMLYLTASPFPWLPEPSRVEGHYYFVNKNLVEMLALMVLATTRSGCWVGLDGLVRFLNPFRWRAQNDSY
jgi:uncharacterized membrane protein YphA (DoxX/SURF4 family)